VLVEFAPEMLFVSVGFDAHVRDPLASMRVTTAGYRRMLDYLWTTASAATGERLVAVTEGGYDLQVLGEGLNQTVDALGAPARMPEPLPNGTLADPAATACGRDAVQAVRAAQVDRWPVA